MSLSQLRRCANDILEKSTAMPFRWYGKTYRCFYCMTWFSEAGPLRQHVRAEHADGKLVNVLKAFITSFRPIYIDVTDLSCKMCSSPIATMEEFFDHALNNHSLQFESSYKHIFLSFKLSDECNKCLQCGSNFDFFGSLLNHVFKSHGKDRRGHLLCDHCGKGFQMSYQLEKHIKGAHEKTGYKCVHCNLTYQWEHQWRYHVASVHKERKFKCPDCPLMFYGHNQRLRHLRSVHKKGCLKCGKCGKEFPVQSQLVYHDKRVHLKEKNAVCGICGRSFFGESNLKLHMVSHRNEKPFECSFCKKSFARKRTLAIHERIHTNDKRCVCKVCGEAFVQTASLKLHMKKHWSGALDQRAH